MTERSENPEAPAETTPDEAPAEKRRTAVIIGAGQSGQSLCESVNQRGFKCSFGQLCLNVHIHHF